MILKVSRIIKAQKSSKVRKTVKYKCSNMIINVEIPTKCHGKGYENMVQFIQSHPLYPAFILDASTLNPITAMEFWYTCNFLESSSRIFGHVTVAKGVTKSISFDVEDVRRVLQLPTRQNYDDQVNSGEYETMLLDMGYDKTIQGGRGYNQKCLNGIWNYLFASVTRCLGCKVSSVDQANDMEMQILYSLVRGTNLDYAKLIFCQLRTKLQEDKRSENVLYPRFLCLLIEDRIGRNAYKNISNLYVSTKSSVIGKRVFYAPVDDRYPMTPNMLNLIIKPTWPITQSATHTPVADSAKLHFQSEVQAPNSLIVDASPMDVETVPFLKTQILDTSTKLSNTYNWQKSKKRKTSSVETIAATLAETNVPTSSLGPNIVEPLSEVASLNPLEPDVDTTLQQGVSIEMGIKPQSAFTKHGSGNERQTIAVYPSQLQPSSLSKKGGASLNSSDRVQLRDGTFRMHQAPRASVTVATGCAMRSGGDRFVPAWNFSVKDDGCSPSVARDFMFHSIPPVRVADANLKATNELMDTSDVSMFNAFMDYTVSRRRLGDERKQWQDQMKKEKHTCEGLRTEIKEARRLLLEVQEERDALVHQGEERVRSLELQLCDMEAKLKERDAQLADMGTQLTDRDAQLLARELEISGLRETVEAREQSMARLREQVLSLETTVESATQARRDLLAFFPELFRHVIHHPEVVVVLEEFNAAALAYGKHLASVDFLARRADIDAASLPFYSPGTYDVMVRASTVFEEMAFPILATLVLDLDLSIPDIHGLFPPLEPHP